MSFENVPKNLTEKAVLIRQGRPDYITLSSDPAPVPTTNEAGAVWEHSDTGDRFRWTSTTWVIEVAPVAEYPVKNWGLEVSTGRIANTATITVVGRNPDVPSSSAFASVWSGTGVYTGFNATTAEILSIVSDDTADTLLGTGARTLTITGLNLAYIEQTETISLNGTTPVFTINSYLRVNSIIVATAGSTGGNVGTITIKQSVTTANVFGIINPTDNSSLACIYTVPANCTASVIESYGSLANKTSASVELTYSVRLVGKVFIIAKWLAINSSGSSYTQRKFAVPLKALPTGTDIKASANSDTPGVAVTTGISFILERSS